jgi:hypothetical protein
VRKLGGVSHKQGAHPVGFFVAVPVIDAHQDDAVSWLRIPKNKLAKVSIFSHNDLLPVYAARRMSASVRLNISAAT